MVGDTRRSDAARVDQSVRLAIRYPARVRRVLWARRRYPHLATRTPRAARMEARQMGVRVGRVLPFYPLLRHAGRGYHGPDRVGGREAMSMPPRTADTMSDAIALSSP